MEFGLGFLVGPVDLDLVGQVGDLGHWPGCAEPFRMRGAGRGEGVLAVGANLVVPVMVTSAGVCRPIPRAGECGCTTYELGHESPGVGEGREPVREDRRVHERLEPGLAVRIVLQELALFP